MPDHPSFPLITKLTPLRPAADVIDRPRLRPSQARARQVRLTLIVAPGGFGKSTLAASWLDGWRRDGLPVAWLGLDPEDDEPLRFIFYLASALNRLHPEVGVTVLNLLDNRLLTEPHSLVSLLINDLVDKVAEAALVIDDYQWIAHPAVHALMSQFVVHAPGGLHLLMATRSQPPLPLGRLRAQAECLDIGAAELRFDAQETASFMAAAPSVPPPAEQVEQLHASTEGWPAALRIAKRARRLPQAGDASAAVGPFGAFVYLLDDALSQLPAGTLAFMARTAVLRWLDAPACNAVTGGTDAAEHLQALLQGALLIEPLDEQGRKLRYHELLREHLLGPVAQRLALDLPALHRRAAHWYAVRAQWTEAVEHALAAGDTETGVAWLARCGMEMVRRGDLLTLLHWRQRFPPELMRDRVELRMALAWGMVLAMRPAETTEHIAELEQTAAALPDPAQAHVLRTHIAALQAGALAVSDLPHQALTRLQGCDKQLLDDWTAEAMTNIQRFALWQTGRWQQALQAASGRPLEEDVPQSAFWMIYRESICSRIWFESCNLAMAEQHARRAQSLYELHGDDRSAFRAIGAPLLADVLYEKGQFAEAEALIVRTQCLIDNTAVLDCVLRAGLVRARSARAQGRTEAGHEVLQRALAVGRMRHWPRIEGLLLLERLEWLGREGRLDDAAACLEDLTQLIPSEPEPPVVGPSDLAFAQQFGRALLEGFSGRFGAAAEALLALQQAAEQAGHALRATVLGLWLAQAQMADGHAARAQATLEAALRRARAGGMRQSVLDSAGFPVGQDPAPPIVWLLRRFLVHPRCDKGLAAWIQDLLGQAQLVAGPPALPAAAGGPGARRPLTSRECEVLLLTELGLPNKEIARRLAITPETVKSHFAKIFHKLEVDNRTQAVRAARLLGLLEPR